MFADLVCYSRSPFRINKHIDTLFPYFNILYFPSCARPHPINNSPSLTLPHPMSNPQSHFSFSTDRYYCILFASRSRLRRRCTSICSNAAVAVTTMNTEQATGPEIVMERAERDKRAKTLTPRFLQVLASGVYFGRVVFASGGGCCCLLFFPRPSVVDFFRAALW